MAAPVAHPLRETTSYTVDSWDGPNAQLLAPHEIPGKLPPEKVRLILSQMKLSAVGKNVNFHLISGPEWGSYLVTPTEIWLKVKEPGEAGSDKIQKYGISCSLGSVSRLVTSASPNHFQTKAEFEAKKERVRARTINEFEILKSFDGVRGFVKVYDLIESTNKRGRWTLTLLEETFSQGDSIIYYENNCPIPPRVIFQIFEDLAFGLAEAHARGIGLRDIATNNVLIHEEPDGTIQAAYCDLAYAQKVGPGIRCKASGTPMFFSPEKAAEKGADWASEIEQPSDIWALGLVIYSMFPISQPTWFESHNEVVRDYLIRLHSKDGSFFSEPEDPFLHLVWEMCQYKPTKRPTAAQVKDKLAAIKRGFPLRFQ